MLRFDTDTVLIGIVGINDGTRVVRHSGRYYMNRSVTAEEEISERTG